MKLMKLGIPAALACLACCAPTLALLVGGVGLAGFGLAGYFESFALAMVFLGVGLMGYWLLQRRPPSAKACSCAPNTGCHSGDACNTP